jgi:membrane associated rhomboid family serine protease
MIALPIIYLGSGLCVWLFASRGVHFGASGLTHGMMFFVFIAGILRWDKRDIALSIVVFFLYGWMIWGIFPNDPAISYESHFFGALLGSLMAFVLKNQDPKPPRKKYDWEHKPEADDPVIGDQWREP